MAEQVDKQATGAVAAAEPHKQTKVGEVVSTKMAKTIVVSVTRRVPHPLYKRIVSRRKRFYAHDENSTAKVGDLVRIIESRPLSKLKRWKLDEVIRAAVRIQVDGVEVSMAEARATKTVKKTVKKAVKKK
jgi:small subunit ribosomal protein S17